LKKVSPFALVVAVILTVVFYHCENSPQSDEQIAKQYCGSCHSFPAAGLLDKQTWEENVLPEMAFRMGIETTKLSEIPEADHLAVLSVIPGSPLVTPQQWESIRRYYRQNAPDSLNAPTVSITDTLQQFDVEAHALMPFPLTTFIKVDREHSRIYLGNRHNKLYRFDFDLQREDSIMLPSPPAQLTRVGEDQILTLMGIMDPNDQAKGSLVNLDESAHRISTLIDSLRRPVYTAIQDLDNDGKDDVVVCAFGNYAGALLAFRNLGDGRFEKVVLQALPGARKVILRDIDNNGMVDILALLSQGDEKLVAFLNQGNFNFRVNTLLRFPAVYGSSFFDVVDFNKDGKFDILYTNGDNADYSMVLKPYHGVRLFINNGNNEFSESWFYNMHGASQALGVDFYQDGDMDIAAISFFPPFEQHPEQGFIYFENTGDSFKPHITNAAAQGRWLTMETADIDKDGDEDILVGALDFNNGVPRSLVARWKTHNISLLIFRNRLHQSHAAGQGRTAD
jgi:hypothetical protein